MAIDKTELLLTKYEKERAKLKNKRKGLLPFLIIVPILCLITILSFYTLSFWPIAMICMMLFLVTSFIYHLTIGSDFEKLVAKVKTTLVDEYMIRYNPDTKYNYSPYAQSGNSIASNANLISYNNCKEEDVMSGKYKTGDFYFSEVLLTKKDSEGKEKTKFKGILFKVKIPNKNIPNTVIEGSPGLISKLIGSHTHNKQYDFWYKSENESEFLQQMSSLLPFISHLKKSQQKLMIRAKGNELVILMQSKMKLLDDPKPGLSRSFLKEKYRLNIARQLNTLLYMVEAFISDLSHTQIEETLELQALEHSKLMNNNQKNTKDN